MAGPRVPDVTTLRAICHGDKVSRDSRPWYVLQRRASIRLTWLLLHTPLVPNQVTMVSVGLALLGGVLLAMPAASLAVAGSVAFVLHHLLDKVDGDIARFRQRFSIVGVYLDELGHGVAFAGIFVGLGLHLTARTTDATAQVIVMVVAALGALAMVLGRQHKAIGFLLYAQYALTHPELVPKAGGAGRLGELSREAAHRSRASGAGADHPGPVAWLRDGALQLSDFSLMAVLVLAGAIVEWATGGGWLLWFVLFAEATLHTALFVALVVVNVAVNVESEVGRLDAMVRNRTETPPRD